VEIRVETLFQKLLHAWHVTRVDVFEEFLAVFLRVDFLKFLFILEVKMTKYSSFVSKLKVREQKNAAITLKEKRCLNVMC